MTRCGPGLRPRPPAQPPGGRARRTAPPDSSAALLGSGGGLHGAQEGLALLRGLLADPPNAEMERRARIVACDYARELRDLTRFGARGKLYAYCFCGRP